MTDTAYEDSIGLLTEPERRLVAAARAGSVLVLGKDEVLRAAVVRVLICDEYQAWPVAPEGVRVRGGRIEGCLACGYRTFARPVWLVDVDIPDGIDLRSGQTRTVSLDESRVGGINAQSVRIDGSLFLRKARIRGVCDVAGATVTGQFSAASASFENLSGDAINAHSSNMDGLLLRDATVKGVCDVAGATITGPFSAEGATFHNPHGDAISAHSSSMAGLLLRNATVSGVCGLTGATITGPFSAEGANFDNPNGDAIKAQDARIGAVSLRPSGINPECGNVIKGSLNFDRATITQHFEISGAFLLGGPLGALYAPGIEATGAFIVGHGTNAVGAITLAGGVIRGRLDLSGSRLVSLAAAGRAEGRRTADEMGLFVVLDLSEAEATQLVMPDPADGRWQKCERPRGIVDLSRARVGTFTDFSSGWPDPVDLSERSCPARARDADGRDADHLVLDGFEYQHLHNPDGNAGGPADAARLRWLRAQSCDDLFARLRPQPWRKLAQILAAQGYEEEARRIAIARRVAQRYASDTGRFARIVSWVLHLLADYGFNPWKAVAWSGGVILVSALVYGWAATNYCTSATLLCADGTAFVRTVPADFVAGVGKKEVESELAKRYPVFDPLAYSFDVFLPFFDVGTERFWRANTTTGWGLALYYFTVAEQIAGALLISLIVTGFTGLLTRDEA